MSGLEITREWEWQHRARSNKLLEVNQRPHQGVFMNLGVSMDPLPAANSPHATTCPSSLEQNWLWWWQHMCPRNGFSSKDGLILPQRQNVLEMLWLRWVSPASTHWRKKFGKSRCHICQSHEAQSDTSTALSDIHLKIEHPTDQVSL